MRVLFVILLSMISTYTYSLADIEAVTKDGKRVVLKANGTWTFEGDKPEEEYEVAYEKNYFYATNGMDERVKVKFVGQKGVLSDAVLKTAVMRAVMTCRFSAKNEPSYIPRSVSIFDMSGKVTIAVEWFGTNAYGAQGKEHCYYVSDSAGELKSAL